MASAVGLHLALHERLINSRPALQAAEFAREQGRFDAMHHELLTSYWDEGRDVSDLAVLREVAARAGVDVPGMEAASRRIASATTSTPAVTRPKNSASTAFRRTSSPTATS